MGMENREPSRTGSTGEVLARMKGALAVVLPVYREVRNRRCCAGFKPPKACDGKRSLDALPGRRFLRPAALAEVPRACYDEERRGLPR